MALKATDRYSQIPKLVGELPNTAYVPIAQGTVNSKTLYKVPIGRIYSFIKKEILDTGALTEGINTGVGVTKEVTESGGLELSLDTDYLNSISIPLDILDIAIVGDVRTGTLPLTYSATSVTISEDIPVIINHVRGVIPKDTVITAPLGVNSASYLYLQEIAGKITVLVSNEKLEETYSSTVVLKVYREAADSPVVVEGKPFSRLGLYRISSEPIGSAAPGSIGSAASTIEKEPSVPVDPNPIDPNDPNKPLAMDIDFLVVSYEHKSSGIDLDTRTVLRFSDQIRAIGFGANLGEEPSNPHYVYDGSAAWYTSPDKYMYWGDDNRSNGFESVMIDVKKIKADYPDLDVMDITLHPYWFNSRNNSPVDLALKTYKGGTMTVEGYLFVNKGGTTVDDIRVTIPKLDLYHQYSNTTFFAPGNKIYRLDESTFSEVKGRIQFNYTIDRGFIEPVE